MAWTPSPETGESSPSTYLSPILKRSLSPSSRSRSSRDSPSRPLQGLRSKPPLPDPVAPPELEWLFPAALPDGARSEILAVVAPKGGQGKTTISINLAAALADAAPNSVVLVDADVQFGDISAALDLQPSHTLIDAANAAVTGDELVLKTYLTRHADGFYVVPGAASPELGDELTAAQLGALLRSLAQIFRYVIVDTTPGLGEHTLAAIENSTDAVFVTNMGVPSLRAMRKELELLLQIGLLPHNKHVVLNFSEKQSGLTVRDAERIVGAKMNVVVPRLLLCRWRAIVERHSCMTTLVMVRPPHCAISRFESTPRPMPAAGDPREGRLQNETERTARRRTRNSPSTEHK